MNDLRQRLDELYTGQSRVAVRFRYGLLAFDAITICSFLVVSMVEPTGWIVAFELVIAALLILDFAARLWLAPRRLAYLHHPLSIADVVVIATLLAPAFFENLAFLRVLRALRLLRSYHMLGDLRRRFRFFAENEQIILSAVNLAVFIFVISALVFVLQNRSNANINSYVDALYFTVSTLTTTGFGDITLVGELGHLVAVLIMVVGVALFLRLVHTIFRPTKVEFKCPDCGLLRHDPDAVHCKHCGRVIDIESEGE